MLSGDGHDDNVVSPRKAPVPMAATTPPVTPWLPLDMVLEIAAHSDPATLVRCAATCREARRRVAGDPSFPDRLRLRHADRFVPSLLCGNLIQIDYNDHMHEPDSMMGLHLADITAPEITGARLLTASKQCFFTPSEPHDTYHVVTSHNGLVLVTNKGRNRWRCRELHVCDLATGRSQILPLEPAATFPVPPCEVQYILLAGDGESRSSTVGRPFQVIKVCLVALKSRPANYLQIQKFSPEQDNTWGPCTEIRAPHLFGGYYDPIGRAMVVGDVVYMLYLLHPMVFVVKLHLNEARMTLTKLPPSFPYDYTYRSLCLLATASAGGSPIILVANYTEISSWVETTSETTGQTEWEECLQPVITNEEIMQFSGIDESTRAELALLEPRPQLTWFAERSGIVLIKVFEYDNTIFFWLDIQAKKVVRWFSKSRYRTICCPYEMDASSWVPTFSNTLL